MSKQKKYRIILLASFLMLSTILSGFAGAQGLAAEEGELPEAKIEGEYPDPETPVTLSMFADYTWIEFSELTGIIPQYIEKETGVTIEMIKATDSNQYNVLLSSDDLPDLISTGDGSLELLSDSRVAWSYNDLIEAYCPDWEIPEIEQKINAHYSQDGNFYFLRNNFNTVEQLENADHLGLNYGQLHMRKDIWEALGSPEMHTKEDLFDILEQVKENYPDMIPLVINPRNTSGLAQLVGFDPGKPTDEDGNFVYSASDPLYREYMRVINEAYREGFMLEENFSFNSDQQVNQFIANGQAFMTTFYAGNDEQQFTAMVQATDPEASFIQVPLFDDWNYTFSVEGWAAVAITKSCHDPETAIKLIRWAKDHQLEMMLGIPDVDFTLNDDGTVTNGERMQEALKEGTVETLYNPMTFILSAADYITESQARFYSSATPETRIIQEDAASRAKFTNALGLSYPTPSSEEGVISNSLKSIRDEYFPILCTAEDDEAFDESFDEMLQEMEDAGLEQYNAYISEQFKVLAEELGEK